VRLALIPLNGKELLCYEAECSCGGDEYLVYVDATSGKEVKVLAVESSDRGRILR